MIEEKTKPTAGSDEIDLWLLLERCLLFFGKYKWIFLAAFLLGLGAGFLTYARLPKVYKSRMVIQSTTLSNPNAIQIIDNWNKLLRSGEHETLAAQLNCDRQLPAHVKQIKAGEVQKMFTQGNPNGIYIDVYVTDNAWLNALQQGIMYGLENSEYVKQFLAERRGNLEQLIVEVKNEIAKLDSLRKKIQQMIDSRQGNTTSLIIDISGINKQLIEMKEKLLYYQQDLKFAKAAHVLQGFSLFSKPAGPNKWVTLAVSIISFLVLAYLITLFISIRAGLKARRVKS
jgi:hypothetical protein